MTWSLVRSATEGVVRQARPLAPNRRNVANIATLSRLSAQQQQQSSSKQQQNHEQSQREDGSEDAQSHPKSAVAAASAAAAAVLAAISVSPSGVRGQTQCSTNTPTKHQPLPYKRLRHIRTSKHSSNERLAELPPITLTKDISGGSQAPSVFVTLSRQMETRPWLGFGGSFTESSAVALSRLPEIQQEAAMKAYFDPVRGLGYSIGRVHIASCDFSTENWTCGPLVEGDKELKLFSLEEYEKRGIMKMLREATALAGSPLTLLASPWSPPFWMKTTRKFYGDGKLLPEYREAWALHYAKFVQEMKKKGIDIWGVSVQNEPEAAQIWESCIYQAEDETSFIRDFLGPMMHKQGLKDVKILFWDHNRDGMLERAARTYADSKAAQYIWGICFHWYGDPRFESWPPRMEATFKDRQRDGKDIYELKGCAGFENVRRVADLRPDKHILFSEGCQELGGRPLKELLGDWKLGERYAMNIINDLNSGCEGFIDWNLFLDEDGGPNHVGNMCSAPVICHGKAQATLYQPSFWYIGHFSRYIRPGAHQVLSSTSRDVLEVTSFLNVDGKLAVVVMNQSEDNIEFWLKIADEKGQLSAAKVSAPGRSISTFVADAGAAA
eukprot:CAMPEP_0206546478 /NCGR_PEP_ID=MMETSP0325_2-20121206/12734_1 /ASSEMBLY_ACC=CAM_ASM_000347 /TAXON_ID=2866 /ORGANISM="Crypthecodinium cohnii, Strain Seligo" /LENGTH=609 /DNA_ID=CAMNT_0054045619 /DNA_START=24 /DNA_END=1849 /DNA_ORIENTATION=+